MIELMVVIAIIGVISGILVIGLKSVITGRQRDQTLGMLKRLDNAMTDITTSPAGAFKLYTIQLPNIYFPPRDLTNPVYTDSLYKNWIGVPSTAVESQLRTALVLKQILSTNPSGKKFLEDLPPDRRRLISWTINTPGRASLIPVGKTNPEYTMPLDAWGNPILFVYDGLLIPTGTNVGRPFTVDIGQPTETPVGGLTYLIATSDKSYYEPATAFTPAPTSPTTGSGGNTDSPNAAENGKNLAARLVELQPATPIYFTHKGPTGVVEQTLRSPDHKPFWMSGGPDGRYDTDDDNVYSFGS
jgi:hypothetical protein